MSWNLGSLLYLWNYDEALDLYKERRARAKENGGGFEDVVAAVKRTERTESVDVVYRMMRAACSSSHVSRSRRLVPNGFHASLEMLCGGGGGGCRRCAACRRD